MSVEANEKTMLKRTEINEIKYLSCAVRRVMW